MPTLRHTIFADGNNTRAKIRRSVAATLIFHTTMKGAPARSKFT
jgi:hypothetical protein